MPPKRAMKKLHQLAVELPQKSLVSDSTQKKQYCIGRQFASGGFGRIYTCTEVGSKKELAIKIEPYGNGPLFTEVNVFIRILKPQQIEEFLRQKKLKRIGVPPLISCGIHQHGEDKLRFLVMPKYAISLENVRGTTTLAAIDVWTIARCMVESLEYIHGKNYTHADIKAANILLERRGDFSSCVLVDYGLARMSSGNENRPDKKRAHNGTVLFTSCDAHRGCHPSYRGDLEILAYNIMYWLSGSLPWQAYESKPTKVHELKEVFLSDLSSSLKKQLKESLNSVAPLKNMFTIAQGTEYSAQLDFPVLYKLVDNALAQLRSCGRKRGSEEPLSEILEVNETSKRNKLVGSELNDKNDEHIEERDITAKDRSSKIGPERSTEPAIPRPIKSKDKSKGAASTPCVYIRRRASPASSPRVNMWKEKNSPRSSKEVPTLGSSSKPSSEKEGSVVRDRRVVKHSPVASKNEDVTRGLPVRRAPCSPMNLKSTVHEKSAIGSSATKNKIKEPTENVPSEVKRSPNKLRKIPGMQNFRRGRRSIVIDQITKKYQKMAQNKRDEKS